MGPCSLPIPPCVRQSQGCRLAFIRYRRWRSGATGGRFPADVAFSGKARSMSLMREAYRAFDVAADGAWPTAAFADCGRTSGGPVIAATDELQRRWTGRDLDLSPEALYARAPQQPAWPWRSDFPLYIPHRRALLPAPRGAHAPSPLGLVGDAPLRAPGNCPAPCAIQAHAPPLPPCPHSRAA